VTDGREPTGLDRSVEARKLAIEAIATLVHVKSTLVELILKPAGVPSEVANRHLYKRDEVTSRPISKRKAAPLILNELEAVGTAERVVRAIITITAGWNAYHLADDEYQARATVHKARDLLGVVEEMEAREESQREWARRDAQAVFDRERAELLRKHSALLVAMFDIMAAQEPHERGYLLQECIGQLFQLFGIPVIRSFTRNSSGEQIDGGIRLEGWYYLIECRWRQRLSDMRELDGLSGQVQRSGKQTMGMFLSINGWSENVPQLLRGSFHINPRLA
jgi:hypothetical protein